MKKILFCLIITFLLTGFAAGAEEAKGDVTLNGEFVWTHRDFTSDLRAVFTPTGEGVWDVSFYFTFRDKPHVYTGTAEGSLTEGVLSGKAWNEDKKRSWTFQGTFKGGVFNGTHTELTEGREGDTGTMTLKG